MTEIFEEILGKLKQKNHYFVWPSEITAQFWRKEILKRHSGRVLQGGRFLSWDRFKEEVIGFLDTTDDERPVNNKKRLLFLNNFFNKNKTEHLLNHLIPREFASNARAFTKKFTEILPSLYNLRSLDPLPPGLEGGKIEDLLRLKEHYSRFLSENKLYEPNYLRPFLKKEAICQKQYTIFFPDIIKDYELYHNLLQKSESVALSPDLKNPPALLHMYENSLYELDHLLSRIADLLDKGVLPGNIAVTAANLEEIEEYLTTRAREQEIPLYIHRGKAITAYRECTFFRDIQDCLSNHFSFQPLRTLLLNRALPWKNEENIRLLLHFGIHHKCVYDPGTKQDPWEKAFKKAEKIGGPHRSHLEEIEEFYKSLKSRIQKVFRARDFKSLAGNFQALVQFLFRDTLKIDKNYRVFQFALESLREFAVTDSEYGELSAGEPFLIWLDYLDDSQYVKETHTNKVAVFPYRVSAGIYPEYHFLINISQKGTKIINSHFPFLNIHEQETLSNVETDLSARYLSLYAHSGKEVYFSVSRKSFKDSNIVPGYFISSGTTEEAQPEIRDLYKTEKEAWLSGRKLPAIYPTQKEGFRRSGLTLFTPKNEDYTRKEVTKSDILQPIMENIKSGELIRISPTWLERYKNCPFNYLLMVSLDLEEEAFAPEMIDHRHFGIIMHNIYQKFYEDQNRIEKIDQGTVKKTVDHCISGYEEGTPLPVHPYWEYVKDKVQELAEAFIEVEKQEFAGFETLETEKALEFAWEQEGVVLFGKIDRLSRDGNLLAIVDYKKRNYPSKRDIFSEEPVSFQMPFYIYLLEKKLEQKVNMAAYYIIEKKQYIYILAPEDNRKPMAGREELEAAMNNIKEEITRYAANIRQGNFRIPEHINADTCRFCPYRSVCRKRYITG